MKYCILQASSVPSEILSGLILFGHPIGALSFRAYTYVCQDQILIYLGNFKIGHYMKVEENLSFFIDIII
jgi:hypothetical protein